MVSTPSRGRRRALAQAGKAAALTVALTTLGLVGVQGQPSATKLMQIPCTSVVPGNQQRVAPVYGLTECYLVTVCIDQPVASDAITPPPEPELPPTDGPPTAPAQGATGVGAARAGARDTGEMPEMGAWEEEAMGPRVPPGYTLPAEDKEEDDSAYYEPSDVESVAVEDMPGLGPAMGPVRTPSFSGKRRLRLGQGPHRRTQDGAEEAFNEAATGVPFSDEWDFRRQRFVGEEVVEVEEPQQAEVEAQQAMATPGVKDGVRDADRGGQAGYVVNPDTAAQVASKQDGGALNPLTPPTLPNGLDPAPTPAPAPAPTKPPTPPKAAPVPSRPQEPPAPPVDDYVGGTGEIAVVRFCSREVVCQECGPVNVVPRCTCSLVLYDPKTDPDYFLK